MRHAGRSRHALRIGFQDSPPYHYPSSSGSPTGVAVEIISGAAKRQGIALEWVYAPEGPEVSFRKGNVDLWPLVGIVPERNKILYLTDPWIVLSAWMVSLESSGIASPKEAAGRSVWHDSKDITIRMADKYFQSARLTMVDSNADVLEGVCAGKADAGLVWGSSANSNDLRQVSACRDRHLNFALLPNGTVPFGIGAALNDRQAQYAADALYSEIGRMARDGSLSALYFRLFLDPSNEGTIIYYLTESQRRNRYMVVGICLLALLLLLVGYQSIRIRAARRNVDTINLELHRREGEYRRLMEDVPEVVWRRDANGDFLLISSKISEVFGYSADEMYRDGVTLWLEHLHPDDREWVWRTYRRLFESGQGYDVEYRIRHRDGHWMWWHARAVAIKTGQEGRRVAEGLLSDITDRKRQEEELRQYREHLQEEVARRTTDLTQANLKLREEITERQKLEEQLRQAQKMEAIGNLSGGIAHDFNNLLTVIKGYGRLVLEGVQHDPQLRRRVEHIDQAAERATALTSQLLAFSRRQVLQPKVLNLNSLVLGMDKMLQRLIGEDIELASIPAQDLANVKADPGQIEQVLMNLVLNARDAMPQGGKITVETATVDLGEEYAREQVGVRPGRYVMLAVSDTGIGMDTDTLAHMFEPFFTTKEQGRGTGLGLSTVYGIVKQSEGHIAVYSELGRGTTFKVYLPSVPQEIEELPAVDASLKAYRGSEVILLVEDDRQVRELAEHILVAQGYKVLKAESPTTALTICDGYQGAIDLLLTDVVMPELNGRELARRVTLRRPGTRVLYTSGYTTNAIAHQGVLEPGTFFLQKPFTPSSLARKVHEALAARPRNVTSPQAAR